MHQTAYKELETIGRTGLPYVGGFCRWWYTPIQKIASFPDIDPLTQMLVEAPSLVAGANWYGPVNVPDHHVGWDEDLQSAKAGHWYKQSVTGFIPGMLAASQINLQNLAYHKLVVVGKVRAGGNFYVIGTDVSGLDVSYNTSTGVGSAGTPGTKLTCSGESTDKAYIIPAFAPAGSLLPPGSTGGSTGGGTSGGSTGGGTTTDQPEIISFVNTASIAVAYDSTRRSRFGNFPTIECWLWDAGISKYYRDTSCEILVDQAPPNQTNFIVNPGRNSTGFITLSK